MYAKILTDRLHESGETVAGSPKSAEPVEDVTVFVTNQHHGE